MRKSRVRLKALLMAVGTLAAIVGTITPSFGAGAQAWDRAVAHGPNAKRLSSSALQGAAPVSKLFRLHHGAGEPTLGFTKNGHVFVTAEDGCATSCAGSTQMLDQFTPGSKAVFMSPDQGKTWKNVTPVPEHPFSLDPMLYVDEKTDRVYDIDLYVTCSYLSYTDDGGKTWTPNPIACGRPVDDHQTVFAGPPVSSETSGYPNVVYYCINQIVYSSCSKSLDGGLTFLPTAQLADGPECSGLNGHGVVDAKGTIYLPLGANCNRPMLAISKDEGDTWKTVRTSKLPASDQDPSVAVDRNGTLYYLFVNNLNRLPYLVISKDGGKHWSSPLMVGAPGVKYTNLATLDVGDPGRIAVAYYGTDGTVPPGKRVSWTGYLMIGKGVLGFHPIFYTAPVTNPSQPLKLDQCGPGRCGRVLDFIDVEISPSGQAWGAFVDACLAQCEKDQTEYITDNEGAVATLSGGFRLK